MRRLLTSAVFAIIYCSDLLAQYPEIGFLRRDVPTSYENYAESPYRPYRPRLRVDPRYDFFGRFLAHGYHVYRLDERRPGSSVIAKDDVLSATFNHVILARNSYDKLNVALTVGEEIRHTLTPLTMQQASFNGVRGDAEHPGHRLTLFATRGFDASNFPGYASFSTPVRLDPNDNFGDPRATSVHTVEEQNPVYTWGGHWDMHIGSFGRLGATFVNQQQLNAAEETNKGFFRGSIPTPDLIPPETLVLRFTDDSPQDRTSGAAVFEVFVEIEATTAGIDTIISSDPASPYYSSLLEPEVRGGRQIGGHLEAHGDEEIHFVYPIPIELSAKSARFQVVVANDYRISVAAADYVIDETGRLANPFRTLDRAAGNFHDYSNKKEIRFDYGIITGQSMYGLDFSADLIGLKLRDEVVFNSLYRKFPVLNGRNTTAPSRGWYLNAQRTLPGKWSLKIDGEWFYMSPAFGGGYESRRGGVVLHIPTGTGRPLNRAVAEFPLVDDNDDRDRYADDHRNDYPEASVLEAGVYPGLDEDNDNIPDEDRNTNGIPDFEEPFLLYFSDPQEFVYGLDMNNNGVIDTRENDDKPDYPYDRDRRGQHYVLSLAPWPRLRLGAGALRMRGIAEGGRTSSTYLTAAFEHNELTNFQIRFSHDSKRVRDSIADPVYRFNAARNVTPRMPPDPDPLHFKNSWVHTTFAEFRLTKFAPLYFDTNAKHFYNRMFDLKATAVADRDDRRTLTMVNKAEYEWRRDKLVMRPMYKRLWRRDTISSRKSPIVSTVQSAPILRVDYAFTDQLALQMGQQGWRLKTLGIDRWLAFRLDDRMDRKNSFSSTDFILMLTMREIYRGSQITTSMGLHRKNMVPKSKEAGVGSKFTRVFVDIVAGWDRHF